MNPWRRTPEGWLISVRAQPGAKKSACAGIHGEALRVRIAAPPVDGKANDALIAFVAQALGVPRRAVSLARGETSRDKQILVSDAGADPARLLESKR